MILEAFRRGLVERHREAVRSAAARADGGDPDETRLSELDAEWFSRSRAREAAAKLEGARSSVDRASSRSVLAFTVELGMLARVRSIDRAIERASALGRNEEARELAEERGRRIADEAAEEWPSRGGLSATIEAVRSTDPARLAAEARALLDATAPLVDALVASGLTPARPAARTHAGSRGGPALAAAPSTLAERVDRVLTDRIGGTSVRIPSRALASAIAELGSGLGFGDALPFEVRARARTPRFPSGDSPAPPPGDRPIVLEEDPPRSVHMILPVEEDAASLAGSLAASAEALTACLRSPGLDPEHRLRSDRSFALALGSLFASIAPEHAAFRSMGNALRRRALAREVLASRIDAAATLARLEALGPGAAPSEDDALERALGAPASFAAIPSSEDPPFEALDRFRGDLLLGPLREKLRTRFGNLWYRDPSAGRWIRDAAEPGGSVTASEIATGLSLPEGSAAWLRETWLSEERRLR